MSGRTLLIRAAQAALLAAIGWGLYRVLAPELAQLSWSDLASWRPAVLPLIGSFALLVVVNIMHALLWRRIMSDLGIGQPTLRATLHVYFVSSLGRYLPGKLWQLAGLAVLSGRAGLPPAAAAAAAVLGQFGFLTTGLLFLGIMLPQAGSALASDAAAGGAQAGSGGTDVPGAVDAAGAMLPFALGAALLIMAGAVLWLLVATPIGHGFRSRILSVTGPRAGAKLAAAFALADRVRPVNAAGWALGYAISWVLLGLAFVLFVSAFDPAAAGAARYLAGTVAAAYLAGYLFLLTPAGLGAREAAMLLLLQAVLPAGGALVVSVLSRVWFTAAELAPLAVLPLLPQNARTTPDRSAEPERSADGEERS